MSDVHRLSDLILAALEKSLEQKDVEIAILLDHALSKAMTRNTGGGEFVERRTYTERMERAQEMLSVLKR
jgi:hypothetical protein